MENRTLWFGHYSSFNDASEIKYGKELVLEILYEYKEENDDDILRQFFDSLIVTIKGFGTTLHHAYISCFCESKNLLSQWREYSDKGGGYCVGFDFTENTFIKNKGEELNTEHHPLLRKVIYDRNTQTQLVENVLNQALEALGHALGNVPEEDQGHFAAITGSDIGNLLVDLILAFKDNAFEA